MTYFRLLPAAGALAGPPGDGGADRGRGGARLRPGGHRAALAAGADHAWHGPLGRAGRAAAGRAAGAAARGGARADLGQARATEVAGALAQLGADRAFAGGGADRGREGGRHRDPDAADLSGLDRGPRREGRELREDRAAAAGARRPGLQVRPLREGPPEPSLQPVRRGGGRAGAPALLPRRCGWRTAWSRRRAREPSPGSTARARSSRRPRWSRTSAGRRRSPRSTTC